MDFLTFWGLILFVGIILLAGVIFLAYWIPKKLGHKKLALVLAGIFTACLILFTAATIFKDYLFFKSDANAFLSNNDIHLHDEFKIIQNDSDEVLDAFQKFTLEISPADKLRLVASIKSADNFGREQFNEQTHNSRSTINYEGNKSFIRKSRQTFEPNVVPIIEIVEVDKEKNILICYKYIP